MLNYRLSREEMVLTQLERRGIHDERVLNAMRKVKRHHFVEPAFRDRAYDDTPLPIDEGQTISQPYVVARMTGSEVGGSIKLKGKVGGDKFEQTYPVRVVSSSSEGNAFVPRLYASTKITELESTRGENAKTELIDLSKRFAVASPNETAGLKWPPDTCPKA